ncbi:ureidoglycolate lyase [Hoeflea marina]|uniref:ureidoglycolate lyase n=1 Tax=Hoeflea marina TaxID=274592 RepID=UPI003CC942CD
MDEPVSASAPARASQALPLEALTAEAFSPFGTVLDTASAELRLINGGTTERFHALATADTEAGSGRTILSLFRAQPRAFPYSVTMMERHPLGSQAFFPMSGRDWIAVVATDDNGRPGAPRGFRVPGGVGLQYGRNVWHHPLIAVGEVADFLVMDRDGPGDNLEEVDYPEPFSIARP